jgi:hypothetical protein
MKERIITVAFLYNRKIATNINAALIQITRSTICDLRSVGIVYNILLNEIVILIQSL